MQLSFCIPIFNCTSSSLQSFTIYSTIRYAIDENTCLLFEPFPPAFASILPCNDHLLHILEQLMLDSLALVSLHLSCAMLTPVHRVSPSLLKPSRRSSTPLRLPMLRLSGPASSPRLPLASTSRVSSPVSAPALALPPLPPPLLLLPPLLAARLLPPPPRPRLPSPNLKRRTLLPSACLTRRARVVAMRRASAVKIQRRSVWY